MNRSHILIVGMGRTGTTAVAKVLSAHPKLLFVDEANFIDSLYIPYAAGRIEPRDLLIGLNNEGWRGEMKFCRSLSVMYPSVFGDNGTSPIRLFMEKEINWIISQDKSGLKSDRSKVVKESLHRIIGWTCCSTATERWLLKQPNLILNCKSLSGYLDNYFVVHLSRNLKNVLRSRIVRGFQPNLSEALKVCTERLRAASELDKLLPLNKVMHARIEDIVEDPRKWVLRFCSFVGLCPTNEQLVKSVQLSKKQLNSLEDSRAIFSCEEEKLVQITQEEMNKLFDYSMV